MCVCLPRDSICISSLRVKLVNLNKFYFMRIANHQQINNGTHRSIFNVLPFFFLCLKKTKKTLKLKKKKKK